MNTNVNGNTYIMLVTDNQTVAANDYGSEDQELMDFSEALLIIKSGGRVQRQGWNGKGMWLTLIPGDGYKLTNGYAFAIPGPPLLPWIGMKTADGNFVPWLADQTSLLANDWQSI